MTQPRDPRTGQFVSARAKNVKTRMRRIPFILFGIAWLVLCGLIGVTAASMLVCVLFIIYLFVSTTILMVDQRNRRRAHMARIRYGPMREEVAARMGIPLEDLPVTKSDHDMTDFEVAIRKGVDELGFCMRCGARADCHVDPLGNPMDPKDFHTSIDSDRWDEVHRAHLEKVAESNPSSATRRALNPARPAESIGSEETRATIRNREII